jgi:hypothetical protein
MKRIFEITNTKGIKLDNVKVPFQVKLLQYTINNILYKYNNKYGFNIIINQLKEELIKAINDSNLKDDKDAQELITKARELYISLNSYTQDNTGIDIAVDNTLKFLLYQFNRDKLIMTLQQEINLLNELKMTREIITTNNIPITERIKNSYQLIEQLKNSIITKL